MREYFDLQLVDLNNKLVGMGVLIEDAIANTIDIIVNKNYDKLEDARLIEEKINESEKRIQALCLNLLLLQAPVAGDLRAVSSALKMITDMERIGDQALDIAEMSVFFKNRESIYAMTDIVEMANQASEMVNTAIDAFVRKDLELAKSIAQRDDIIDGLFEDIKKELVDIIHNDKELGLQAIDVMLIAKYLERIGDHAVNISEWVVFSITGE
ncbi:MAG: phosphate signaling complex protein PhoU [Ruminococcus sp.]|nr:phosphate signaling complex protein PhoU [Ruminococcus sp.]